MPRQLGQRQPERRHPPCLAAPTFSPLPPRPFAGRAVAAYDMDQHRHEGWPDGGERLILAAPGGELAFAETVGPMAARTHMGDEARLEPGDRPIGAQARSEEHTS